VACQGAEAITPTKLQFFVTSILHSWNEPSAKSFN
jgi:hypothetical protein